MLFFAILILALAGCTNKKEDKTKDETYEIPKFKNPRPFRQRPEYLKTWLKKVSISIAKTTSAKEALGRLAILSNINLNLEGVEDVVGVHYSAFGISFLRALKTICRLCGWRVKITNNGDISVLNDSPYFYTHEVAFLLHLRKMKLATSIGTISRVNDIDGTQLYSENELNLWDEIEQNLKFLLKDDKSRYTVNKQGGLIIVNATQSEHENIAKFLRQLYVRVASQVFIEGKIVEVSLQDPYANGIEWNTLNALQSSIKGSSQAQVLGGVVQDLVQGIDFLKTFGKTKTLANPCTFVLNNQFAIFQCVENRPYYRLSAKQFEVDSRSTGNNQLKHIPQEIISSDMQVIPIGVIFIVQPSIDFTNRSVTLCLKPSMSSIKEGENVQDPAVLLMGMRNPQSNLSAIRGMNVGFPVIKEKSIDTIINIKDGETAIIGGLIQKNESPARFKISGGKVGVRGAGSDSKEMVMLIKVSIVEPERDRILTMAECEIMDPEL